MDDELEKSYQQERLFTKQILLFSLLAILISIIGVFGMTMFESEYQLQVRKVYPEVREGKFRCDFIFRGERPENIRTGQTYYIDLELGQPEQAVLIPRGTFFQTTGGQWIFVLDKSGSKAYRRNIRIGRQNPQHYEVLEGLEPGERVVTSGYEAFKDNEILEIK